MRSAPRCGQNEEDRHERKDEPMKLTTMTQVTVDGVMQGNGGASDEDRRNGFERGGWALGLGDNETMTFINQTYQSADAFLFGRRTYELFAGYWGAEERARAAAEDPGNQPITDVNAPCLRHEPKSRSDRVQRCGTSRRRVAPWFALWTGSRVAHAQRPATTCTCTPMTQGVRSWPHSHALAGSTTSAMTPTP